MKKRILLLSMLVIVIGVVSACGKSEKKESSASKEILKVIESKEEYNPVDCVTLGEYKGVTVTTSVTDEEVTAAIEAAIAEKTTVQQITDRVVADGDTVHIKFVGSIDGKEFEGGSSEDYELVIGSNSFIDGFEQGLIGAEVGKELVLNLKFPAEYNNAELAGKDVVFKTTVNYINGEKIVPELNDKFVESLAIDAKTVADYKAYQKETLQKGKKEKLGSSAFDTVMTGMTVKTYPETMLAIVSQRLDASYRMQAESSGIEWADFLSSYSMTEEDYKTQLAEATEFYTGQIIATEAIAKLEGITTTEEEYKAEVAEYLTNYGMKTEEALSDYFVEKFHASIKDIITESILMENVMEYLASVSVEN